jgi:MYXO-CTERM domain-containing protein
MKRFYLSAALVGLLAVAGRAEAGTIYDFSISGGGLSGSGTLDVSYVPASGMTPGGYFAMSSTGSISGDPNFTDLNNLLTNPNAPGTTNNDFGGTIYPYDDKVLIGSSPLVDFNGLVWTMGSGPNTIYANLYYVPVGDPVPTGYYFEDSVEGAADPSAYGTQVTFTLSAVPEPSTLASGGMAVLVGLGLAWRRRRRALSA